LSSRYTAWRNFEAVVGLERVPVAPAAMATSGMFFTRKPEVARIFR
jgi:hypothetical protein